MKNTVVAAFLAGILGTGIAAACENHPPSAQADPQKHGNKISYNGIQVTDFWTRPTVSGGTTAVYMTLYNKKDRDDELLGISTDNAESAEIHNVQVSDQGVMQMSSVAQVAIPAGQTVEFKPKSLHLMLIGVKESLQAGQNIKIKLRFAKAGEVTVGIPVKAN